MKLAGKVALVTGANRGIGRGCALALAREGADIAINYRRHKQEAASVAAEVKALGRQAVTIGGSVADRAVCFELVDRTVSELGRLDVLVANAAASVRKPFLELEEEDMQLTLGVTLWGVFHCCQFAARRMVAQDSEGSIIIISSVHAVAPYPGSLPYNTAKAGVNHMARSMAGELAEHRIRVNVVEPGWTDTPGERQRSSQQDLQEAGRRLPMGRLATADEIARGVAFLASDDASYITGSVLRIDGGFVLPHGVG